MKTTINCSQEEVTRVEIRSFVAEGLEDLSNDKLLDFDSTFDELEERYSSNE
ncbi:MAG: hypothetical protein IJY10_07175 [Lachnospiraceae bacterium]|nr:hypothetical protein [Lachnospiraceae bacterium]MBQ9123256.1 hypothetical protein [Lachnospiraceae bacterium]